MSDQSDYDDVVKGPEYEEHPSQKDQDIAPSPHNKDGYWAPSQESVDRGIDNNSWAPNHEVEDRGIGNDSRAPNHEAEDSGKQDSRKHRAPYQEVVDRGHWDQEDSGETHPPPPPPEHRENRKRSRESSSRDRRGRSLDSSSSDSGDEWRMARTKRRRKHSRSDSSPSPRRDRRRSKKWHRAARSSSREVRTSDTSTSDESDYERYRPKVSSRIKKWKLKGSQKKWVRDAFTKYYGEEELDHVLWNCPPPSHTFLKADELDESLASGLPKKVGTTAATIALQ